MIYRGLFVIFFTFLISLAFSQQYTSPVNIPVALSGNFGELRSNHFHSGIDYKTQQVENKPIIAIEDGYVSRINVSPGGYGLALYVEHPATGHTSVYGHLNSFSKQIADYVKEQQYARESYRVELYPGEGTLPVKKGEQIALSGNTGSSGGPHLHFEIRDSRTQDPLDPMKFLGRTMTDTRPPDIRGVAFYPLQGKGVVNGNSNPLRLNVSKNKSGVPLALSQPVNAWGKIGIGVKAYDRMNGQANIYGVKHIRLFVDENRVYSSSVERFSFAGTRMLNSFTDFEDWRLRRSFFMKSFVEPGNSLPFYDAVNNGVIDINEERNYRFRYELEDHHGNTLTYSFVVRGQPQPIAQAAACDNFMSWKLNNSYVDMDFMLDIPSGNLYDSFCYTHRKTSSSAYHSDTYQVNDSPVPLHNNATLWIKLSADTLQNKRQYGIVEVSRSGSDSWIGGKYRNGGLETSIRELGRTYAIDTDTVPPVITPQNPANWAGNRRIRIRLTDNKSGIANFRGTINGQFVLFAHDMKSSIYTYVFDDSRLEKGKTQELVFTAEDGAGNTSEYRYMFEY
ncbi:MAG: M23 family metallopeptidase [Bacteroidia bacterium]|nr:M23 family metallopeptidase [Bacteroidia bacterium]